MNLDNISGAKPETKPEKLVLSLGLVGKKKHFEQENQLERKTVILERNNAKHEYIDIEQVFKPQLLLVTLSGGIPVMCIDCKWGRQITIVYQIFFSFFTRMLAFYYIKNDPLDPQSMPESESFSRASKQNFRLFWVAFRLASIAIILSNWIASIYHYNLIKVILKKRFDKRFLFGDCYDDKLTNNRCPRKGRLTHIRLTTYFMFAYIALSSIISYMRCYSNAEIQGAIISNEIETTNAYIKTFLAGHKRFFNQEQTVWLHSIYQVLIYVFIASVHVLHSLFNFCQTHGQTLIVLMITATITEMLKYACQHDSLVADKELTNHTCKYKVGKEEFKLKRRSPLLTTDLLIQLRDVLITLRCAMSFGYLIILLFDLSRLMTTFNLINTAVSSKSFVSIVLMTLEFLLVTFSMILTRIGYHWLHSEVKKLKRYIDERNYLERNKHFIADQRRIDLEKRRQSRVSQPEKITIHRLAEDIESLWPTDWFKPDFESYFTQNIIVITLVATLQQLVEASGKGDYTGNN